MTTKDLQQQLYDVDQALTALGEVISVRREYAALLERVGPQSRQEASLTALTIAWSRLKLQRDGLAVALACQKRTR